MDKRPILNLPKTSLEKGLNAVGILAFMAMAVYLVLNASMLPDQIPTHFNAAGEPDDWSSIGFILLLPAIGVVLWIGLTILERYPHVYNYIRLNEDNVEFQYRNARMMINVIKNLILILFSYLTWQTVRVGLNETDGLGEGFIYLFNGLLFGATLFFVIRSLKK
ncbi:DUF1648 domain-containing protein [Jeotgalibacillus campisalis]|uniref:DUF1648 domain-containing protein n=1 Tax=Jeotgalibacillus campisalis TaxID=220754 RepID=A0A0C2RFX6_9BACL|nr:DUF1648 domain-containing protein [Jeotgalibacillus campisalis]KIL49065.1 hypothetical protein KR50_11000 [Jeotgalibacillus campisalis]